MNILFLFMSSLTIFIALLLIMFLVVGRLSALSAAKAFGEVVSPKVTMMQPIAPQVSTARLSDFVRQIRSSLKVTDDPALQRQFECAALTSPVAKDMYFAARFGGPVVVLALASFSPYARLFCMCAGAGLAYLAPAILLGRLVKRHRQKVRLAIPDAVDLLVICVDAGLGLDQAMVRVGEELQNSHPAIYREFSQINREQRAGKLRLDAWHSMAERVSVPETDALVNMLMQTERFGTPIARALSSFGDTVRQKRRQKAEELAAKTTIKIIFPLVFFIFPCVFIVLLGPAAISIYHSMSSSH